MTKYPVPPDDDSRVAALDALGVMEAMDSPALDQIVRLVATSLDVPIALVSIVGRDLQRFRANYGLADVESTPREVSLCSYVVMHRDVMVVPNAALDPRFTDNPLVTGSPGIRAYAGAPLVSSAGVVLGALCTIDRRPRQFSEAQIGLLKSLAEIATALLESEGNRRQLQILSTQLATRQRELRSIADHMPAGIAHVDLKGGLLFFNQRLVADAPDPAAAAKARTLAELLGGAMPEAVAAGVERARRGESSRFELVHQRHGEDRHLEVSLIPDRDESGNVVGHFGIRYDVTERVRQREDLRKREQFLRGVFDSMAEGLVVQDGAGRIVEANQAAEYLLGMNRNQLLARTSLDPLWQVTREDGTSVEGADHPSMQTLRTGEALRQQVLCVRTSDGVERWLSVNTEPLFDGAKPAPTGVVVTFADITHIKQLQLDLSRARAALQDILDHVPAQIASWNPDASCRFANRHAAATFTTAGPQIVGRSALELAGPERWERARPFFEATLKGHGVRTEFVESVAGGRRSYRQVEWIPQREGRNVVGVYSVVTDVTTIRVFSDRIRELAHRLQSVREQERRSIALTLHEGVAQDLFAMRLELSALRDSVSEQEGGAGFENLAAALDQCINDVRNLATNLQPGGVGEPCIGDAIRRLACEFRTATGILVHVQDQIAEMPLDAVARALLFRSADEALRNAAQHGKARQVQISLERSDTFVAMRAQDDGVGPSRGAMEKPGTLGLLALRERAVAAGGALNLTAAGPRGAVLMLRLPISTRRKEPG